MCSPVAEKYDNFLDFDATAPRRYIVQGFSVKDANPAYNPPGAVVKELLFFDLRVSSFTEVLFDDDAEDMEVEIPAAGST